ncbi:MAG TPA: hypothetical protein VMX58_12845 [Patescibacteria group bacterium]|nr:hypothetical protein [Patescibacteria group bacterium]
MSTKHEKLALRHAPVLHQKIHEMNPRGDYITRVDLRGTWDDIVHNWEYVRDAGNALEAAGYYSVAETTTHYFILYAFYHAQDWYDGKILIDKIRKNFDEHLHDMEGALAVVTKRPGNEKDERVDAFITISHFHFYCYANWMEKDNKPFFPPEDEWRNRIRGFTENVDGNIWPVLDGGRPRFSLYAQARGHGIRGDRKAWGLENKIIRYFPSLTESGEPEPAPEKFFKDKGYLFQDVRYHLIDIHEPDGLWANRSNPNVFQTNDKGQDAFVKLATKNKLKAGSANPPWGWDDMDDRHKCGELAINPARIVHDYFTGLREYSLEYVFDPYLRIGTK